MAMNYDQRANDRSVEIIIDLDFFITIIKNKDENTFDELLVSVEEIYKNNKAQYSEWLLNLFINLIDHTHETDFLMRPKELYVFLEKFFEVIQRMGGNPVTLKSIYEGRVKGILPCNSLLRLHSGFIYGSPPSRFLEKVIYYLVEIGVPIYSYERKFSDSTRSSISSISSLHEIATLNNNPTMQNYLKLIGRYNKQLFNVNEGITNIEVLEKFIAKITPEEQNAIFKVAATRGHSKPLMILGKIDDKKYSMEEALNLAKKRNLTKIVTNFEKQKNVGQEVIDAFKDIKIAEKTVKEITPSIKDFVMRAHSKKFNAMIDEFRKHEISRRKV